MTNIQDLTDKILAGMEISQIKSLTESISNLEFSDFYDLAEYGNKNWKGSFTPKEVACNAYDYYEEYQQSVKQGHPTHTMMELYNLLKDDDSDEVEYWLSNLEDVLDFT